MAVSPSPRDVSGLYNIEIARLHPLPLRRPRGVWAHTPSCVISTERSERRNLWNIAVRVLYSPLSNTNCIRPSRSGAKTRSKARAVLPCLQGEKRARRNRRRMGVCPWQLVAESASFSAADYRAQASGEIFSKILRGFYTVCLATLTAYNPRAAGQRPVRLAAIWRLAQGDTSI